MCQCTYSHCVLFQPPLVLEIVHPVIVPMVRTDGSPDVIVGEIIDRPEHLALSGLFLAPRDTLVLRLVLGDCNTPVGAFGNSHTHQHSAVVGIGAVIREFIHQFVESVCLAGVFLNGRLVLFVDPNSLIVGVPHVDEVLVRGQRIGEIEWDLEPVRFDLRQSHNLLHVIDGSLPFGLLVEPKHLEGQSAQLSGYHQCHMEQDGAILTTGHTDNDIVVVGEDKAKSLHSLVEHVVFQIDHCRSPPASKEQVTQGLLLELCLWA